MLRQNQLSPAAALLKGCALRHISFSLFINRCFSSDHGLPSAFPQHCSYRFLPLDFTYYLRETPLRTLTDRSFGFSIFWMVKESDRCSPGNIRQNTTFCGTTWTAFFFLHVRAIVAQFQLPTTWNL
jgi:hypothetical protein